MLKGWYQSYTRTLTEAQVREWFERKYKRSPEVAVDDGVIWKVGPVRPDERRVKWASSRV